MTRRREKSGKEKREMKNNEKIRRNTVSIGRNDKMEEGQGEKERKDRIERNDERKNITLIRKEEEEIKKRNIKGRTKRNKGQ